MELFLVILIALASSVVGLNVKKNDFVYKFGLDDATIDEYRKAVSSSPARKTRTGATPTVQSVNAQFRTLQERLSVLPVTPATASAVQNLDAGLSSLTINDAVDNLDKIQKVFAALERNWGNLTGDNVAAMAKGVCDVVASVAAFAPPPYGTIISTLLRLVSNIIGISQGRPKSMGEIVQEIMHNELQQQYLHELRDKIQGAIDALETNQIFINSYTGGAIEDRDYDFMISQFQVVKNFELRGQLMGPIGRLAKSKKRNDAQDAVNLLDHSVVLISMVEVLMHTMKSILAEDKRTQLSARSLGETIEASRAKSRLYLNFIRNPTQETGAFFIVYNQAPPSNVESMMDSLKITPTVTLKPGCYTMKSKHRNKEVSLRTLNSNPPLAQLVGNWFDSKPAKFQFIKSGQSWSIKTGLGIVCASESGDSFAAGCKKETEASRFRVHAFTDGGYMIMNEKWPTNPIRMKKSTKALLKDPTATFHAITAKEKDKQWDEKNPQFIWELTASSCIY